MLRLQLFGGLSLLNETGSHSGPVMQRRKLALLARAAASPRGSISRDKLIGCFWPEEDRERARHHLADSVFTLRKHLGKDAVVTVGDDLLVNPAAFSCDLWRFLGALEAGQAEQAVTLYAGPFLDGFFVSEAAEFEQWVEEERRRLSALYAAALEGLAEEALTVPNLQAGMARIYLKAVAQPQNPGVAAGRHIDLEPHAAGVSTCLERCAIRLSLGADRLDGRERLLEGRPGRLHVAAARHGSA